jgi:hypothetical protein
MAEKKTDTGEEGVLAAAAKAIGSAAGKVAALAGVEKVEKKPGGLVKRVRVPEGRLPKKDKSRLPRRQKKALAKQA